MAHMNDVGRFNWLNVVVLVIVCLFLLIALQLLLDIRRNTAMMLNTPQTPTQSQFQTPTPPRAAVGKDGFVIPPPPYW